MREFQNRVLDRKVLTSRAQALHKTSRYEEIRQDTSTSSGRGNDQLGKNLPARDWARPQGRYGARWLLLSGKQGFRLLLEGSESNAVYRGQRKACQSRRGAGAQVYDAWSYAIRLRVLPSQPIRATSILSEHRTTLQGNAPVLARIEHQARLVKLQADWQAGAQDEQNENEVR